MRIVVSFGGIVALSGCAPQEAQRQAESAPEVDMAPWNSGRRPARAPAPRAVSSRDDGSPVVLGALDPTVSTASNASGREGLWSIFLAGFRGEDAAARAIQLADQLRGGGLEGTFTEQRDSTWVVAYGGYQGPSDEEAQRDLNALRGFEVEGNKPFQGAILTPPKVVGGSMPEYDLGLVRKREGGKRAKYTLQIAQYCRPDRSQPSDEDLKEFRRAAEEACLSLRREGEDAFFYHGPRMSLVTIGLFTENDFVTTMRGASGGMVVNRSPIESAALKAAREKFPNNLINGQAAKFRERPGTEARVIPSTVVAIPD